jgi:hypothetical protein
MSGISSTVTGDEQIRRQDEDDARFAHAAKVHERDARQNREADRERVRLQRGRRRHERAGARRDPHGDDEHVVQHQRRGGEQARIQPEVLTRHGVRAAARRVRGDRLQVRDVHDRQQRDDRDADRDDEGDARHAERDEQRHRRFGTVRRGAQRVEAEHRHGRQPSDLLLAFFVGRERPAEQQIGEAHRASCSVVRR